MSALLAFNDPSQGFAEAVHGLECTIRAARQDRIDLVKQTKRYMTAPKTKIKIRGATRMLACLFWIGRGRPSVLWHFLADDLRYLLVKLGFRPARQSTWLRFVRRLRHVRRGVLPFRDL